MSPPTGTVIKTSCEYNPVHKTLRNSPDSEGSEVVISGKYAISCLGGSSEGLLNFIVLLVENGVLCLIGAILLQHCCSTFLAAVNAVRRECPAKRDLDPEPRARDRPLATQIMPPSSCSVISAYKPRVRCGSNSNEYLYCSGSVSLVDNDLSAFDALKVIASSLNSTPNTGFHSDHNYLTALP